MDLLVFFAKGNGDSNMETDETELADNSEKILQKNLEKVNSELSPLPAFMNTPKNKNKGTNPSVRSSLTLRSPPTGLQKKMLVGAPLGAKSPKRETKPASPPARKGGGGGYWSVLLPYLV